jgi:hypothetical protein
MIKRVQIVPLLLATSSLATVAVSVYSIKLFSYSVDLIEVSREVSRFCAISGLDPIDVSRFSVEFWLPISGLGLGAIGCAWACVVLFTKPGSTYKPPKGLLIDLLVPPERAGDMVSNLLEAFNARWVVKYGHKRARFIFATQSVFCVLCFWGEWARKYAIPLIRAVRKS